MCNGKKCKIMLGRLQERASVKNLGDFFLAFIFSWFLGVDMAGQSFQMVAGVGMHFFLVWDVMFVLHGDTCMTFRLQSMLLV